MLHCAYPTALLQANLNQRSTIAKRPRIAAIFDELTYTHQVSRVGNSLSVYVLTSTAKETEERINKVDLAAMRKTFDQGILLMRTW